MPKTPKQQINDYEKAVKAFEKKIDDYKIDLAKDRKALRAQYTKWTKSVRAPMFMEQFDKKTKDKLTKTHKDANRLTKPKKRKPKSTEEDDS